MKIILWEKISKDSFVCLNFNYSLESQITFLDSHHVSPGFSLVSSASPSNQHSFLASGPAQNLHSPIDSVLGTTHPSITSISYVCVSGYFIYRLCINLVLFTLKISSLANIKSFQQTFFVHCAFISSNFF